jgi:hypothetical protein
MNDHPISGFGFSVKKTMLPYIPILGSGILRVQLLERDTRQREVKCDPVHFFLKADKWIRPALEPEVCFRNDCVVFPPNMRNVKKTTYGHIPGTF